MSILVRFTGSCWVDLLSWRGMEETESLLEGLVDDALINVLRFLDEPGDSVRFAAASKTCQKRVVEGRCVKDLCIRNFPEVSMFKFAEEQKMNINEGLGAQKDSTWENLEREHKVYTMLAHELMKPPLKRNCICKPIQASSTDNYPDESVINTLDPRHRKESGMPCYWSSKGESNVEVPETLTYALHTNLCVVHEVKIRPFKAYFQRGYPIYSSDAVRFRFGYSKFGCRSNKDVDMYKSNKFDFEDYVWMYVSPEYPMQQADILQSFKLPRPVLCIGGILQVEFLGRVQTQETDRLYYICVCHVHVVGRPLTFLDVEVLAQPEQFILKHSETQECLCIATENTSRVTSEDDATGAEEDDLLDHEDDVIDEEEDDFSDLEDFIVGAEEDDHLDSEDDVIGAEEDDHLDPEDDVIGAEEDDHLDPNHVFF